MFNGKYTTLDRVIENVIRDTGFSDHINYPDAVEWAYRAMRFIGAPQPYIKKVTDGNEEMNNPEPLKIENYRAELPCDLIEIISVREWCSKYGMRTTTYAFNLSTNKREEGGEDGFTYNIMDNYIYTNFKDGYVELAYLAFPLDCNGYPMIPDDERYLKAIESYITERISRKLYLQDRLSKDKYEDIKRDWLFYVNSAKTKMHMPSIDEMESLKNQLLRLFQSPNRHKHGFVQLGDEHQQRIRYDRFGRNL